MTSPQRTAHMAGAMYLVLFVCGSFSIFVRSGMVVPGDALATSANILASEFLFRLQLVSELVMSIAWLMVAFLLYILFRTVHRHMALLFLLFAAIGVATICANMCFKLVYWSFWGRRASSRAWTQPIFKPRSACFLCCSVADGLFREFSRVCGCSRLAYWSSSQVTFPGHSVLRSSSLASDT